MKKTALFFMGAILLGTFLSVAPAKAEEREASDRDLVVATLSEPKWFSNLVDGSTQGYDVLVWGNLYDQLLVKDWSQGGKIVGGLAETFELKAGGRELHIKLRDNIYFHDGSKLKAEDVAHTFDVMKPLYLGVALLINYDRTEVIDELNCVIHLTEPFGPILSALCSRIGFISSKEYWDKVGGIDGYLKHPVGTGPYKFVSYTSGDRVVMERNEDYWQGKPYFARYILKSVPDANTAILAVETGEADACPQIPIGTLMEIQTPEVAYDAVASQSSALFMFNFLPDHWTAKDLNFRKAVQWGIDKDAIVQGVYNGKTSYGDCYGGGIYEGTPKAGTYPTYSYDPAKAKEFLAKSNYDGRDFRVLCWSGTAIEKAAEVIQASLHEIGINMQVVAVDGATFWDIVRNTNNWDARYYGVGASHLDMDGMNYLLPGKYDQKTIQFPHAQELIDLIMAGRTESDPEKRRDIYRQMTTIINDEVIQIDTHMDVNTMLYRADLKNVKADYMTEMYKFFPWNY